MLLTDAEQRVVEGLGEAFNAFCTLPVVHPSDLPEFVRAIHTAQNIVLARPVVREQLALTTAAKFADAVALSQPGSPNPNRAPVERSPV